MFRWDFPGTDDPPERRGTAVTPEETLARRVAGIEADHTSGASALALQAVDVLDDALGFGRSAVERTGRALCRAQPTMAPIWNAAALALGANGRASLQRLRVRMLRAPGEEWR